MVGRTYGKYLQLGVVFLTAVALVLAQASLFNWSSGIRGGDIPIPIRPAVTAASVAGSAVFPPLEKSSDSPLISGGFLGDPSMTVRCEEKTVPPSSCDATGIRGWSLGLRESELPPLQVGFTTGPTTSDMTLKGAFFQGRPAVPHPIFEEAKKRTAKMDGNSPEQGNRVFEFNGVHSAYEFDCLPSLDFRQYHQVRAALCTTHEDRSAAVLNKSRSEYLGIFPIADEEYMEYALTLSTAWDAATSNRPYTYLELGARYGTWIARAGQSYRLFASQDGFTPVQQDRLRLLAVEGNCHWYRKMEEHIACNHLEMNSILLLSYVAPKSYNKVIIGDATSYAQPRAVSIAQLLQHFKTYSFQSSAKHLPGTSSLPASTPLGNPSAASVSPPNPVVDMLDLDIQGFESISLEGEPEALEMMADQVAFVHFGTHGTRVEKTLLKLLQAHGFCLVYFFAGAHTKLLHKGHRCETPFGSSVFNDGVMGFANPKFYSKAIQRHFPQGCPVVKRPTKGVASTCYWTPLATTLLQRD